MNFEIRYPGIFLLLAAAALYFAALFYLKKEKLGIFQSNILFTLKFIFYSLIAVYFFDPVTVRTEFEERPVMHLFLFDNSVSIKLNDTADSTAFVRISESLAESENFRTGLFGERTRPFSGGDSLDFTDRATEISSAVFNRTVEKALSEHDIRSVTLVTDGNFTDAANYSLRPGVPVNIIRSSLRQRLPDIFIRDIYYDELPSASEESEFTAVIGYSGKPVDDRFRLTVKEGPVILKTVRAKIPSPGSFTNVKITLPPPSEGSRELEFVIEPLADEKNIYNNEKKTYQRKQGRSGKILLLYRNRSFDVAFLEKILRSAGYLFDSAGELQASDISGAGEYSLLITVGLPGENTPGPVKELIEKFSSSLHFTGPYTDLAAFERIHGTGIKDIRYIPSSGRPAENRDGSGSYLFIRNGEKIVLSNIPEVVYNSAFMPPDKSFIPLVSFASSPGTAAVYQRKGKGSNTMIANFSSFWKPALNDTGGNFAKFMLNLADQAGLDDSRERMLVEVLKNEYFSGEKIAFSGSILDENLRPARNITGGVDIEEIGLYAPLVESGRSYSAEIIIEEPGIYTATVSADIDGKKISRDIILKVTENDLEKMFLGADSDLINRFVSQRGGTAVGVEEAEEFISAKKGVTETVELTERTHLSRNFYFFAALLLLFLAELAYRKYLDLS